jgi:CMP-N,N'-diacetyllegionaminic acid synthase
MNIKTIILARGGSKGIPNKNIINLNGKPLIAHSIKAAKLSIANEIWVSTDCPKIMSVSIKLGVNVIQRPKNICQDNSKSEEALMHFASLVDFDILVFIQPTSPMINSIDIDMGLAMMEKYDSVFSAYKEHWIPRWNQNLTTDNWDVCKRPMRQQMPDKWVENGAIYITTKNALLSSKNRYSGKIGVLEMPLIRSFQVDTMQDLALISKIQQ